MKDATRSSKKRYRDSKLDSPRKKPKQHTLLSQAFLVEDSPYCPPQTLRPSTSKIIPKDKSTSRILPRLAKKNRRDPLHVLNDDEVYQIIGQLAARETETMRRVSKLWKATPEYQCGKFALLKHFPWAAWKLETSTSREEANLQFRRHCMCCSLHLKYSSFRSDKYLDTNQEPVYHQESLIAGNATRALQCTNVAY